MVVRDASQGCMVVSDSPQNLYGGLGFLTGYVWLFGILHRVCMFVLDSLQDGKLGFLTGC